MFDADRYPALSYLLADFHSFSELAEAYNRMQAKYGHIKNPRVPAREELEELLKERSPAIPLGDETDPIDLDV